MGAPACPGRPCACSVRLLLHCSASGGGTTRRACHTIAQPGTYLLAQDAGGDAQELGLDVRDFAALQALADGQEAAGEGGVRGRAGAAGVTVLGAQLDMCTAAQRRNKLRPSGGGCCALLALPACAGPGLCLALRAALQAPCLAAAGRPAHLPSGWWRTVSTSVLNRVKRSTLLSYA